MNIEISLQEYFEELRLMEEQYGQEEDLYPWIYMLLQMAECRKKSSCHNNKISIRNVHMMSKKYDSLPNGMNKNIRSQLTAGKGAPDFAIINKEGTILGCIEIKKLSKYNAKKTAKIINSLLIVNRKNEITGEENIIKDLEFKNNDNEEIESHLTNCKKVLYTNGIEFYFLKKGEDKSTIIKKLADLTEYYKKFRKLGIKGYDEEKGKILFQAEPIWQELINGLISIHWYEDDKKKT